VVLNRREFDLSCQGENFNTLHKERSMALMDFIKKQFIDIIQWTEEGDGTLAWRFPMRDMEIQNGAQLVVRESQMALFVSEGKIADLFGPGTHKLITKNIPLLTNLNNWDKLFESPFKSDVYFFSTRQQLDAKWGTPQPITVRDKDFGAVRLRAFGNYAFRMADPKLFHTEISGTRERYEAAELDGQLRGLVLQNISNAIASSGIPFLDLAANQQAFAGALTQELEPAFAKIGLKLEGMTVQNVSLAWAWSATTWANSCNTKPRRRFQSLQKIRAAAVALRAMRWAWAQALPWGKSWRRTFKPGWPVAQMLQALPLLPWSNPMM
jgi:hypothetical protein